MADGIYTEEWRIVEGWPDYEVSNLGRVRRAVAHYNVHWISGLRYVVFPAGFVLKLSPDKDGYPAVTLVNGETKRRITVCRLTCRAFNGPRPTAAHQVAHGDGNRSNGHIANLRWATPKENSADMIAHGTSLRGERNTRSFLSEETVRAIRKLIRSGRKAAHVAREFGIGLPLVYAIKHRRCWGWLSD